MSCTTASSSMKPGLCGVPKKCWCSKNVDLLVSKTNENPYRRFYRCEVALKRKHESHLFKWFEVAMAEELENVVAAIEVVGDEARSTAVEMKDMCNRLRERLEEQEAEIEKLQEARRVRLGHSDGNVSWWTWRGVEHILLGVVVVGGLSLMYQKLG
ncbi:hypothetical protein N665_0342s0010 [Sinapis alba]|nr:hypothetical protein N665_0342s0010 [Sinapis alba]